MPQTEYAIQLEHVTKTFGPVIANHDVTMNIRRGEILSLLGENGSGKTTLMNMIAGIYYPDGGQIIVNGQPADIRSPRDALALGIGMIHQHFKLVDVFTAVENIALSMDKGEKFDLRRVRDKARAICEKYQFALDLDQKVYEMSVSQKQTLEIVKVLFRGADILILDEPTSFLDIRYKLELLTILKNMAKEKQITVIMSLHEIDLAQKISDKILCVKGDTIFGYGEPEAIFKEDFIQKLYEIDNGHFDPVFGSVELAKAEGEAEVFVISSGGSGIPVYRNLQKAKIPFSAGILYTNDIDYHLAEHLAVSVIEEEPFEPVSDRAFERAKQMIRQCKKVINAGIVIGTTNQKIKELLVFAEEMGKLESYEK